MPIPRSNRPRSFTHSFKRSIRRGIERTGWGALLLAVPLYMPYSGARPVLDALRELAPATLRNPTEAAWDTWRRDEDRAIRARLRQGDLDSMVNFLLFGTSFTKQPIVTPGSDPKILSLRLDDLGRSLAAPGGNERLLFLRSLIAGAARQFLIANVERVAREQEGFATKLAAAKRSGDTDEEFAERSKLYRDRGLSLDTSIFPSFGVEESLRTMKERGLLAAVRRAAVIGPGLDFADKQEGYDFYPQQTIQPFALYDTLLRLGLAKANDLAITAFDISPRSLDHLRRATVSRNYVLQLSYDPGRKWKPGVVGFWERCGDRIGAAVQPIRPPAALEGLRLRAVRIRPEILSRVRGEDLNIVVQRMPEQFDLVIATNILVYYDTFEQSLAFANIESMLRPGGFLLSNNALLELPSGRMHSIDYRTVVYAEGVDAGDHIVWYRKQEK